MAVLRTGLIGKHISRTRLPAALQIMCDDIGLGLEFKAIDTAHLPGFDLFDLGDTLERLRQDGWTSVSVTHPFKTAARDWVGDGMDAQAAHLLSCNTVVFGSPVTGHNTDYTGFVEAWRTGLGTLPPGHVVMAGAGGVAQAIGPALKALGARSIGLYDPDAARARALAGAIGAIARPLGATDLRLAIARADGVVNATPLGMAEHPGRAFDPEHLAAGQLSWAFDAVYTPVWTPFLQDARAAGLRCLTGFDLFKAMAINTFAACSGHVLPEIEILPLLDALHPDRVA